MTIRLLMGNEAIAWGAMHAGVQFVAGYPGTPSTEVLETVAKLNDGSVHVEWSTNEKAALEAAIGASWSGARAMVTMKQVGLNVAADPLMTLSYIGVKGGLVLVVADDPGPISSQTEQDTRTFGLFSKVPVLDPVSSGECYGMVQDAFEFSEKYNTPVILRPTTRVSHACGTVKTRGGVADCAPLEVFQHADVGDEDPYWQQFAREPEGFVKDTLRWVVFPRTSRMNHAKAEERSARIATDLSNGYHPNRIEMGGQHHAPGTHAFEERAAAGERFGLGIACGGISYHYVKEALELLGADVPVLKVGTPFPFPCALARRFMDAVAEVLVVEELDPYIERQLWQLAGREGLAAGIHGKLDGTFAHEGEQTVEAICAVLAENAALLAQRAEEGSLATGSPCGEPLRGASASATPSPARDDGFEDAASLRDALGEGSLATAWAAPSPARDDGIRHPEQRSPLFASASSKDPAQTASRSDAPTSMQAGSPCGEPLRGASAPTPPALPARPPVLCAGCPHRASFYAVKRAMRGRKAVFCGDIGCYTLGNAAPLDMVDTCVCMGADITIAQGIQTVEPDTTAFSFIGDSTFFASGITGVINAVYNHHDITICVLDNSTTAMTGQQPHPGTGRTMMGVDGAAMSIPAVLDALGVDNVTVDPCSLKAAIAAVREQAAKPGVKAVIFKSPCVNVAKPTKPPVQVDQGACIRCYACIDQLGCPAIALVGGQVRVNETLCYGCGLCAQVCPKGALVEVAAGPGAGENAALLAQRTDKGSLATASGEGRPSPARDDGFEDTASLRDALGEGSLATASAAPSPARDDGIRHPEQRSPLFASASSKDPAQNASRSDAPTSAAPLNCVVCGVGGQGNVLASRLIADVLLARNEHVKTAETIGMAQRGGSVASHVRGGRPQSPLVPKGQANVIIAFEPGEAVRCLSFAAPGCTIVVNTTAVAPPTAALTRSDYDGTEALAYLQGLSGVNVVVVDGDAVCAQLGSSKCLNIVLLAAAVRSGALGMTRDELETAVRGRVKPRFHELNLHAIELVFGE